MPLVRAPWPDDIAAIAGAGEDLGFDIIATTDHIVVPRSIESRYPYSDSGRFMPVAAGGDSFPEQLSLLSYVAAMTTKPRLLTSVMVVPHRGAVLAAKAIATLDVLSKGRTTLGCGAGWMEEESDAVGAPPFADRGRVTDEHLGAYRELWTEREPAYDGEFVTFSDIGFEPKPVQDPHPPIWIGGEGMIAMRRAARFGDGWYPISTNPRFPMNTADLYGAAVRKMRNAAEDADRDPATIDLALMVTRYKAAAQGHAGAWVGDEAVMTGDDARQSFTGTARDVAEDIARHREIGLRHMVLQFLAPTVEETIDRMTAFMEEVKPLVSG
jgi:probable F420-dependent oxidoreductase